MWYGIQAQFFILVSISNFKNWIDYTAGLINKINLMTHDKIIYVLSDELKITALYT